MNSNNTIAQTIQLILAPVVMITACGILLNGLLIRYAAIETRLREMNRELLVLDDLSDRKLERLQDIDRILPDLLHRHHLIQDGLLATYSAIVVFMLNMLMIAVGTLIEIDWLFHAIIFVLLTGVGVLLLGMARIAQEFSTSHRSIQLEIHFVCRSCKHGNLH